MSYYGYDNTYMLDTIRRHPKVFAGVAVIDPNEQPVETMRQLMRHGVRGFRIQPPHKSPETWLDGQSMAAIWQAAADLDTALCCLIDPPFLPAIDRMCRRFADTPVVIDHLGRIGIDGRIRDEDVRNLCALAGHRRTFVKVSAFYALGRKSPPYTDLAPLIRRVFEAFGPQRLMWASDAPFQVGTGHDYCSSIDLIRTRLEFLNDSDRQWLLGKTAEQVFFEAHI
jgi:predicted TIM-barrel fold metal-dependent hydrolase